MLGRVRNSWRQILGWVLLATVLIAAGLLGGYFIGQSLAYDSIRANAQAAHVSSGGLSGGGGDGSGSGDDWQGKPRRPALQPGGKIVLLRNLPPPNSSDALALLSNPDTPASVTGFYTFADDVLLITEELTVAFLERLQHHLDAYAPDGDGGGGPRAAAQVPRTANGSVDLAPFVRVARDVLSYLRYSNSQALLLLLRQFSSTGSLTLGDIHPDTLQGEVDRLLNLTELNQWYRVQSKADVSGHRTLPPPSLGNGEEPAQAGSPQLLASSAPSAPAGAGGRRLLLPHGGGRRLHRRRRGLLEAGDIPLIPDDPKASKGTIPTAAPLQDMNDMLCSVKGFSPVGLSGISLPGTGGKPSGKPRCEPPEPVGFFSYGKIKFKPVTVPVVFHVQRFQQGDKYMPPVWEPEAAGQNLVDIANKRFKDTGIRFVLQEVRHDPVKYPYLLLASLSDWQACTGNPKEERAGFPCLTETAKFDDVAALTKKQVVSVLVSGSSEPSAGMCDPSSSMAATCRRLYLGYNRAMGPWWSVPSPTWSEDSAAENWLFISWDQFDPKTKNAERFWDGGGCTVAHELGHYMGLMHTHEGSVPCDGDGLQRADAVPDTPANKQVDEYASERNLLSTLAGWCSDFRNGKKPDAKELLPFNSCDGRTDNVFNLMSYLPDPCCMVFTPNQVARLQWAVAAYRPKMMARYAT